MLWLLHHQRSVIRLEWGQNTQVNRFVSGPDHRSLRGVKDAAGRSSHILGPGFDHQVTETTRPDQREVLEKNTFLVSLGYILVKDIHETHVARVRFRVRRIAQDGDEVFSGLGQREQVSKGSRRYFDRRDCPPTANVGDMADGGPASRPQV